MYKAEFIYNNQSTIIQFNLNEKMEDIIIKYETKIQIEKNTLYYLYQGNTLNKGLLIKDIISPNDKEMKIMKIIVNKLIENNEINNYIKSKNIICPECGENCRIKIKDYLIDLYDCKNGHNLYNISLDKFEETQKINISKIICEKCKENNKSNTYKNEFYKCLNCQINICPLCKLSHDKNHDIINYEQKYYICEHHNELYIKYCNDCKKNICVLCAANKHKTHNIILYEDIISDKDEIRNKINELRKEIDIFNNNIQKIIDKLKKVMNNMEIYYNIYNDIMINYGKSRNYEILQNAKEINNNIFEEINKINNENNIYKKFNHIMDIYNNMINDEINIIYNINDKDKKVGKIKIFGDEFVKNNKNICRIEYEDNEYELSEEFNIKNINNNKLEIKLKGINSIINMSFLFSWCDSLSDISNISKWNTINVTNMSFLFYKCSSLKSLPDISKWNTNNVINMCGMFGECESLEVLPDISKWNIKNVKYLGQVFLDISSPPLTDIEYLNILIKMVEENNNINFINGGIFDGCSSLSSLPDISKWNTNNVINMHGLFRECNSLSSLPDISKWNTNNVTNMQSMFFNLVTFHFEISGIYDKEEH